MGQVVRVNDLTITYKVRPGAISGEGRQVLGLYFVNYADGFRAAIPHVGWPSTVSEEPLNPDVPEHRAIILEQAAYMRSEYEAREAS